MAYQDYVEKFKSHLSNWSLFSSGKGSSQTFDAKIDTSQELNALRNSASSEQLIHFGNAYYDQVAVGRAIKELYKTPKDYHKQFDDFTKSQAKVISSFSEEISKQHEDVKGTSDVSKVVKTLSPTLQKKLANVRSEFDGA